MIVNIPASSCSSLFTIKFDKIKQNIRKQRITTNQMILEEMVEMPPIKPEIDHSPAADHDTTYTCTTFMLIQMLS